MNPGTVTTEARCRMLLGAEVFRTMWDRVQHVPPISDPAENNDYKQADEAAFDALTKATGVRELDDVAKGFALALVSVLVTVQDMTPGPASSWTAADLLDDCGARTGEDGGAA